MSKESFLAVMESVYDEHLQAPVSDDKSEIDTLKKIYLNGSLTTSHKCELILYQLSTLCEEDEM
jgi:hypothetical protein